MRLPMNPAREFFWAATGSLSAFAFLVTYVIREVDRRNHAPNVADLVVGLAFLILGMAIACFGPVYALWLKFRFRSMWPTPRSPSFLVSLLAGVAYTGMIVACTIVAPSLSGGLVFIAAIGLPIPVAEFSYRLIRFLQNR